MLNKSKNDKGFTLIELMITISIIGILLAVAIPSYSSYLQDSRRTDAVTVLLEVAGEQERFFAENNSYAATMADLGYGTGTQNSYASQEGHYNVSVSAQTARTYTLTATPVANGAQASDACGNFMVTSTGGRSVTGTATDCWR